jgi:hypothetical protein
MESAEKRTRRLVFAAFDRWKEADDLLDLGEFDRTLVPIWSLKGMVDGEGFDGFYGTSTARYGDENIATLRRIGAHQAIPILELAHEVYEKWDEEHRRDAELPLELAFFATESGNDDLEADWAYLRRLYGRFDDATEGIWELLDAYVERETCKSSGEEESPEDSP